MSDWITHTLSAVGGALTAGFPLAVWVWSQANRLRAERLKFQQEHDAKQSELDAKIQRDNYEMDKIRRSDAYQELSKSLDDLKRDFTAEKKDWKQEAADMNKKIGDLQARELDCLRKSAEQMAEIASQKRITEYLEGRVKTLEASLLPQSSNQGAALAGAVKEVAKEAIAEARTQ